VIAPLPSLSSRLACGTALLCAVSCATAASALGLVFPGSTTLVASTPTEVGQHPIATDAYDDGEIPNLIASGQVTQLTWQIAGVDADTLMATLQTQIEAQGYAVPFTCDARACGGFDFRHGLPVGDAPAMHVDLGNFHYLTATRDGEDGTHYAALMISQGGDTGFVHLALIQPETAEPAPVILSTRTPDVVADIPDIDTSDLIALLTEEGAAPLDDLVFETGASALSGERYASLVALAEFLNADPSRQIVLVGHTDALGSLSGNIALSRARAGAVREFLIAEFGVSASQIEAEGIGYLSPRASNETAEGREANRRVEVVLALQ